MIFAPFGSSPLTRGKLTLLHRQATDEGLIPAHAGKTTRVILSHYACPAHPRSRGENAALRRRGRFSRGSSPLTRGKRSAPPTRKIQPRLIPAHAGKTRAGSFCPGLLAAHPRSRGENPKTRSDRLLDPGSSPLTRGKLKQLQALHDLPRLIPAHAGKTVEGRVRRDEDGAHPRSRGENPDRSSKLRYERGSSPLTRGKLGTTARCLHERRLIPAHAGKTRTLG